MAGAAELRLILSAVDNASKVIGGVTDATTNLGSASATAKDFVAGMGISMDALANPAMLAGQAVRAVYDYVQESIAVFEAYGLEVEDMGRKLGVSAEEASTMIQVADDLRVSTGTLEIAFRNALKNGIEPSIGTLKDMATQYQALEGPVERAAYVTENFGARSLEMQKILEQSPEKLQEMADSVSGTALVMTQEGVEAAKAYQQATDALGDAQTRYALIVASESIPTTTRFKNTIADLINTMASGYEMQVKIRKAFQDGILTEEEYIEATRGIKTGSDSAAEAQEKMERALLIVTDRLNEQERELMRVENATRETTTATEQLTASEQMLWQSGYTGVGVLGDLTAAMYNQEQAALASAAATNAMVDAANRNIDSKIFDFLEDLRWLAAGGQEIQDTFDSLMSIGPGPEQTEGLRELYAQALALKVELGDISFEEAGQSLSEDLNIPLALAYELLQKIKADAQFDITSFVRIYYDEYNKPDFEALEGGPASRGNSGGGGGSTSTTTNNTVIVNNGGGGRESQDIEDALDGWR